MSLDYQIIHVKLPDFNHFIKIVDEVFRFRTIIHFFSIFIFRKKSPNELQM